MHLHQDQQATLIPAQAGMGIELGARTALRRIVGQGLQPQATGAPAGGRPLDLDAAHAREVMRLITQGRGGHLGAGGRPR